MPERGIRPGICRFWQKHLSRLATEGHVLQLVKILNDFLYPSLPNLMGSRTARCEVATVRFQEQSKNS
jgi:hypothetical protein